MIPAKNAAKTASNMMEDTKMADKATNGTGELVQAYNRAVESAIGAFDTGFAQAGAAAKALSDAAETERAEFGKALEQGAAQARQRGENMAAALPGVYQAFVFKPGAVAPEIGPEVKESVGKLIAGETAFYESMAQSWVQYLAGLEQRRGAAAKALMESNAKVIESGQQAAKGAVEYGEALFGWSVEASNARSN